MILIHVYLAFHADQESVLVMIADSILGGFMAAPVFMCSMGIGMAYSRNQDPVKMMKRGVNLMLLGYLLNLLRRFPGILVCLVRAPESLTVTRIVTDFFEGDILQFAGLAFILFGILRRLKWNDTAILILGILFTGFNTFFPVIESSDPWVNVSLGLVTMVSPGKEFLEPIACFPLLSWFIFVAFGYWFGNRLKYIKNLNRFYGIMSIPCLLLCVVGCIYEFLNNLNMMSSTTGYYHMVASDVLISLCYCMFCFGICHFICKITSEAANTFIKNMSNALNTIYMTHWVAIGLLSALFGAYVSSVSAMTLIAVGVGLFSIWFGMQVKMHKKQKR